MSLPAVAGMRHYVDFINVTFSPTAATTASATPVTVTTANLPGNPAITVGLKAWAIGEYFERALDFLERIDAEEVGEVEAEAVNAVGFDEVDEADGAKIAHHVFGDNEQQVVNQLGGLGGGNALIQKLLPILAPIVMSWLAGKLMGADEAQGQTRQAPSSGGGGLGDILGQILGGGASAPQTQAPQAQPSPPQFRVPTGQGDDGTLRMPEPQTQPTQTQSQAPSQSLPGGLGGGILGDILGGLLGGGRR